MLKVISLLISIMSIFLTLSCVNANNVHKIDQETEVLEKKEDKKDLLYWLNLGINYCEKGRYKDAKEAFKQAVKTDPDSAPAHYYLGISYGKLGKHAQEIDALKQAIRIEPGYARAHYSLGLAYKNLGKYRLALEAFKEAIKFKPDDMNAYYNLGTVYLNLRMIKEAKEALKQAIKINPDFAEAHYTLGTLYLIQNDRASAFEEYKILRDLDQGLADKLFNQIYD
jgi:tetratricopeptide (TPR) repeat protein